MMWGLFIGFCAGFGAAMLYSLWLIHKIKDEEEDE